MEALRELDDDYYRVEKTYTRASTAALNEGLSMDFYRLASYASVYNDQAINLLNSLGYSDTGWFSVSYTSPILPSDTLLGVRYVFSRTPLNELEQIDLDGLADGDYLYYNPDALSVGYGSSSEVTDTSIIVEGNPFETQNRLASAILGYEVELFTPIDTVLVAEDTQSRSWEIVVPANTIACSWLSSWDAQTYIYTIEGGDAEWQESSETRYDNARFRHAVRMLNEASADEREIRISLSTSSEETSIPDYLECMVYGLDLAVYQEMVDALSDEQLEVTQWSGSTFAGTIEISDETDGVLLSIPYDYGWTVTLDGEKIDVQAACEGAMMFIPIGSSDSDDLGLITVPELDITTESDSGESDSVGSDSGESSNSVESHVIEMSFVPPMLREGIVISALALVGLVGRALITRRKSNVSA